MPPRRCLLSPGPTWLMVLGTWAQGWLALLVFGRAAPARVLPGETAPPLCFFAFLVLALLWLSWALVLPRFTSPVLLGATMGAAPTARAQVKGYKGAHILLYTDNHEEIKCLKLAVHCADNGLVKMCERVAHP